MTIADIASPAQATLFETLKVVLGLNAPTGT